MKLMTSRVFLAMAWVCCAHVAEAEEPQTHTVTLSEPERLVLGTKSRCRVTVTPLAPWELKADTPFEARLASDTGIYFDKARLDNADFEDPRARAKTVRTGCGVAVAGEHLLTARLVFFLCTKELCMRVTDQLTAKITAAN